MHLISEKGRIYQINLEKKEGEPFSYLKYRDITQLGRYFGITLNDKVTRLYTTVNFLVEENTKFLEKHLKMYKGWVEQQTKNITSENKMEMEESKMTKQPKETERGNESTDKAMIEKKYIPPIN